MLERAIGRLPAEVGFDGARGHARFFESGLEGLVAAQYVEWRLGSSEDRVDFLVALDRPGPRGTKAFRTLAERSRAWPEREQDAWRPVVRLGDAWSDPGGSLRDRVPTVWLELDDVRRAGSAPPSVCACLVPEYARPLAPLGPPRADDELRTALWVLELVGAPASGSEEDSLRRCFACLPREGRLIHLSVMLGRTPRAVKLYGMVKRAAFGPYLQAIGWRGDMDALQETQATLYDEELVGDEVFFDLNLSDWRSPDRASLGLAFAQQHVARGPDRDPDRRRALDRLVHAGLCHPAKAAALRGWSRASRDRVPGEALPWQFVQFLDIKLVWQADRGLSAKAYLGTAFPLGLF